MITYFMLHAYPMALPDYELKQEFCYPGTSVWIGFEHYGDSRFGRWQPLYSVSLKNTETGQLSPLCYSYKGNYKGAVKLFSLQTAKQKARFFAPFEFWLKAAGVTLKHSQDA